MTPPQHSCKRCGSVLVWASSGYVCMGDYCPWEEAGRRWRTEP